MVTIAIKCFYTLLLVSLTAILIREIWLVWNDGKLYVGQFDVLDEKGRNAEASSAFPARVVSAQELLARQLENYQTSLGSNEPTDATYLLPGRTPLSLPSESLSGLDITVENIKLTQLFSALRKSLLTPKEVSGKVVIDGGLVYAFIDWPSAPALAAQKPASDLKSLLVPARMSIQDSAGYVASSIAWARAASTVKDVAKISRIQFCDFAFCLNELYSLSEHTLRPEGLNDQQVSRVRSQAARLKGHLESDGGVFRELFRIRADLLDLLPERSRTQDEIVDAQEDRIRYAMLDPNLSGMTEVERSVKVLALARPAILLEDNVPKEVPSNWTNLFKKGKETIRNASQSVGAIILKNGSKSTNTRTPDGMIGTGFIVAPGIVMTATHVHELMQEGDTLTLCLESDVSDVKNCSGAMSIGKVIYKSSVGTGADITLAELHGHEPLVNPPLLVAAGDIKSLAGAYAFLIGYPTKDPRTQMQLQEMLIGKLERRKRLLPGRILSTRNTDGSGRNITTDISSSPGMSGAPLVDLGSGRVIGVHIGGAFQQTAPPSYRKLLPSVKFAYSSVIPVEAVKIIERVLNGESIDKVLQPNASESD